jgi:hypothetical protein
MWQVAAARISAVLNWHRAALSRPHTPQSTFRGAHTLENVARWEYSYEVVRLFQNAVASDKSFLAHCQTTVRRRYKNDPFLEDSNGFTIKFSKAMQHAIRSAVLASRVRALRANAANSVSRWLQGLSLRCLRRWARRVRSASLGESTLTIGG